MNVEPWVAFSLVEVTFLFGIGMLWFSWQWLKLRRKLKAMESDWLAAGAWVQQELDSLQHADDTGDSGAWQRAVSFHAALAALFQDELKDALPELSRHFKMLQEVLQQAEATHDGEDSDDDASDAEQGAGILADHETSLLADLPPLPSHEVEVLLANQAHHLAEIAAHRSSIAELSHRYARVNRANLKLLRYLQALSEKDRKFKTVHSMFERLQQNGGDVEAMMRQIDRQKALVAPHVQALVEQNERLAGALKNYRRHIEAYTSERVEQQARVDELNARIERRNKSYDRLHKKFDALRREYIALYELAAKCGIPRNPPPSN